MLHYRQTTGPRIFVKLYDDFGTRVHEIPHNPEDVLYIVDMLRNEKPLYYDTVTKFLTTSREEPGEEES